MDINTIWSIIVSAAITTVITTIIGVLIKKFLKDEFGRKEELDRLRAEEQRRLRQVDMLETISEQVKPIAKSLKDVSNQLEKNSDGTITLLRNEMKNDLDHYREQGFASSSDKANWNELYASYKNLGGNHFREYVNQWKNEVELFPLEKKKKIKKEADINE